MRFVLTAVGALLTSSANAWMVTYPSSKNGSTSPMEKIARDVASIGFVASIGAALAFGGPSIADAADFVGSYSDPKHPNCPRLVAVEGNEALVSGADGNPSCPTGNGKPWRLIGQVNGDEIFVDFSPKGGPKDLKGVWEEGKKPGILWPDGNKWSLEGRPN